MILLSVAMAFAGPYRASSNIEGDVNADGEVNIADINVLIGHIMNSTYDAKGDMNHDGEINIADINVVIDIILNGPVNPIVDTGIYMGITGYNQTLITKELTNLDSTTVAGFNSFVDGLTSQPGRLLYYSVDKALDVGADVHGRELVGSGRGVDAVGEEKVDEVVLRVDPHHDAGEAGVAEAALRSHRRHVPLINGLSKPRARRLPLSA